MNQETKLTEKQQKKVTKLLNKVGIKIDDENCKLLKHKDSSLFKMPLTL